MRWWDRIKYKPYFIRLFHFEYWSMSAYYWPLILFYLPYLCLRARHLTFYTAANPGIYTAGLGLESKFDTIQKIPERFRPKTILVRSGEGLEQILANLKQAEISFPLIAKPDVGFRGLLVKKINDQYELETYLQKFPITFLLQEFIALPVECGILYYRYPGQANGAVSSVTLKKFLGVVGDGEKTVFELIQEEPRAILQLPRLQKQQPDLLSLIPEQGKRISLGIIGNHSKGTMFIKGNHLIDQELVSTWDKIWEELDGIDYGRFDIRGESWEKIKQAKDIKILEINGVCSEPTHIYDPINSSYFKALRDILQHWTVIGRIARANHANGTSYMPALKLAKAFKELFAYQKQIKLLEAEDQAGEVLEFTAS